MYKTPKLKENFIPCDWNEGNTPDEFSDIKLKKSDGIYHRVWGFNLTKF